MVLVVNKILAVSTILAQFSLVIGFVYYLFSRKDTSNKFLNFLGKYGIQFGFFFALIAMVSSLFYSDVAGFAPCVLCWYQRIAMYPLVLLFGMAWIKKDHKIVDYTAVLALIGLLIALMHVVSYFGGPTLFNCDASGLGVSCNRRYVFEFGYITIPVMALTSFFLTFGFSILKRRHNKIMAAQNQF